MTQFREEVLERVLQAVTSLDEARDIGDDHMVEVRTGELESLAHLATENELHLPELDLFLDQQTG